MKIIILVLVALKIAGVGQFSWYLPIGLLIAYVIVNAIIIGYICRDKTGEDWHDGMFD
jgi:hypothetical protein